MAAAQQSGPACRPRLLTLHFRQGAGPLGSLASGQVRLDAAPPAGTEVYVSGELLPGEAGGLQNFTGIHSHEQVEGVGCASKKLDIRQQLAKKK